MQAPAVERKKKRFLPQECFRNNLEGHMEEREEETRGTWVWWTVELDLDIIVRKCCFLTMSVGWWELKPIAVGGQYFKVIGRYVIRIVLHICERH